MATPARRQQRLSPQQARVTARGLRPQQARIAARGLREWARFADTYDNEVVVQDSSGSPPACWIFCTRNPKNIGGETASPLLTKTQAKKLIRGLQKFIESGEAA